MDNQGRAMHSGDTSIIYPGVVWGGVYTLGPFVLVGQAPRGHQAGELVTRIGAGAYINSHTVIYAGNSIGANVRVGHGVLIREQNEIGDDVSIGSGSNVEHHVRIGNRVRLHSNVFIPEWSILEDDCWLGPNVVLTNAKYPATPTTKEELLGVHIEKRAKIGANTTLLPGVCIGTDALVGAGAVVTVDVPPGAVVAGNPARIIKYIAQLPAYNR